MAQKVSSGNGANLKQTQRENVMGSYNLGFPSGETCVVDEVRTCNKCKHCSRFDVSSGANSACARDVLSEDRPTLHPVTGEIVWRGVLDCEKERRSEGKNKCGLHGKYWEPI